MLGGGVKVHFLNVIYVAFIYDVAKILHFQTILVGTACRKKEYAFDNVYNSGRPLCVSNF